MSKQELSPWDEEKLYNEKKLRKHEQKLRERLEEAQKEQEEALERLRRAEERMRKRMIEVQHLEERLNIVHQQMEALQAPHATVVTMISAGAEAFAPMIEASSSSQEATSRAADEIPVAPSSENAVEPSPTISIESIVVEDDVEHTGEEAKEADLHPIEVSSEEAKEAELYTIEESPDEEKVSEEEAPVEVAELVMVNENSVEAPIDEDQVVAETPDAEVIARVQEARAIAEAAEEAVRVAVERAVDLEAYLEQVGATRHLVQELERLQAEADRATAFAREAKEAAQVVERLVSPMQSDEQQENTVMSQTEHEVQEEPVTEMRTDDLAQASEPDEHPSPLEVAQVAEIEEEEEDLETVTAMIIADAAGIAAVQAEAEAEASSARTREVRVMAIKADQALEDVRLAIRQQKLSGEGAEVALRAAEKEATYAHAALADAEAAEERALNAAMNAEAEAEVAEGMAFAASSRDERDEKLRDKNASV